MARYRSCRARPRGSDGCWTVPHSAQAYRSPCAPGSWRLGESAAGDGAPPRPGRRRSSGPEQMAQRMGRAGYPGGRVRMPATMSRSVLLEPARPRARRRAPPGVGATRGELAACAVALLALAGAVFGSHIVDGGFYWDDWQLAARARFPPLSSPDYHGVLDLTLLGYRPVLALLLPAVHAVLGFHMWLHLALALLLAVATALCFHTLLREVGLPPLHAAAIAALSMVFPWSDSMRLWSTAAVNTVGVCLYLLGTVAALRGLRARGRRAAVLGATGAVLYALSILTYEVAAATALLSILLYARVVPWWRAWRRWAVDVVAVGTSLAFV